MFFLNQDSTSKKLHTERLLVLEIPHIHHIWYHLKERKKSNAITMELKMGARAGSSLDLNANKKLLFSGLGAAEDGLGNGYIINEVERGGELIPQEIQTSRYPLFKRVILPETDKEKIEFFKEKILDVEKSLSMKGGK